MDTKLKKTFKLKNLIITLVVLTPALLLTAFYPKMEAAMVSERADIEREREQVKEELETEGYVTYEVESEFINYAMEASYYIYGQLLQSAANAQVDFSVLQEYGWISDYHMFYDNSDFIATYIMDGSDQVHEMKNAEEFPDNWGRFCLQFDSYGNLTKATSTNTEVIFDSYSESIYEIAMRSESQYRNNVAVYNSENERDVSADVLRPKNFTIEFTLDEESDFVHYYQVTEDSWFEWAIASPEYLYMRTGAYWLTLIMVAFVGIAALLLPLIRSFKTGHEKLFYLPLELVAASAVGLFFLGYGMCYAMAYSTMDELSEIFVELPQLLGDEISRESIYYGILALNFLGWSVVFFLEYIIISCLRNILLHPIQYLKNHTLFSGIFRWAKRNILRLYRYVTDININEKLSSSIVKIVLVNLAILTALCCLWFFGIIGLLLYSIGLYIVLRKYGEKLQKQYHSILHAAQQMADGDLKISMEKDLGIFAPIGESLEEVQQGFQKAVVEEAKSQQMKSELITNVSHDLKTPLTAIITYVDLLKKEDLTEEERKKYIATLDQKSQRLKHLIEDLFEVSKAQSGNVKMNFMEVDVVSLFKQVRSEMSDSLDSSDLQFRWNLPDEKIILMLDGQRMYRVFENLLGNILKYAMPKSRVYVDLIEKDKKVEIQFRNVSAMELDFDVERLTERFVRGDMSRNTDGNGLGLAIAKSFVELQKGTFHIRVDGDLFKVMILFDKE